MRLGTPVADGVEVYRRLAHTGEYHLFPSYSDALDTRPICRQQFVWFSLIARYKLTFERMGEYGYCRPCRDAVWGEYVDSREAEPMA
jgi:hypothetical protein